MKLNDCLVIVGVTAFLIVAPGCATPAKSSSMIPTAPPSPRKSEHSLSVSTKGGQATNPLWTSQISSEAFQEAIVQALTDSGTFKTVVKDGVADLRLEVTIVNLDQPFMGASLTVTMVAAWKVTDTTSGRAVFNESITTPYTAKMSESLIAIRRLRLANEGAARENIKEGIRRLSGANL